jgi:hypothetical protein
MERKIQAFKKRKKSLGEFQSPECSLLFNSINANNGGQSKRAKLSCSSLKRLLKANDRMPRVARFLSVHETKIGKMYKMNTKYIKWS